ASGVTRADFPVRTEYGVAGKVTDASGQPLTKVRVELVTSKGARVLSGTTDQFGLYRLDGVPVGSYTLRVPEQDTLNSNDALPKRQVVINNKFVYNQNLQLPVSAAAKKKKDKK
ncbi:MAG: carboxypeptidase-like regulatory domain-containing protein, partial [Cyanobacteria bacterium P01_H01_bin.150]